jgi:hypothetical protein
VSSGKGQAPTGGGRLEELSRSTGSAVPSGARALGGRLKPSTDAARIVVLWAAWLAVICAFQILVQARVAPQRPDNVLGWTQYLTGDPVYECQQNPDEYRPRLADPNMNEHVAYDSEYYLSIAATGYDDPTVSAYMTESGGSAVPVCQPGPDYVSLNYAFMPGYPMAMRPVMAIEGVLPFTSDLSETGRATLAGIVVSALGGLLAMLALARLMGAYARRKNPADPEAGAWGGLGGIRAAFYLLVFPTGFYLAQVYTEGLFIGLAFMACALAVEKKVLWAALFAALATWVRPAGVFLFFPLAWAVFEMLRDAGFRPRDWRIVIPAAATLAPLAAFGAWYQSTLGERWRFVEDNFFSRRFDLGAAWDMWVQVWNSAWTGVDKTSDVTGGYHYFTGGGPEGGQLSSASMFYIALEFAAMALALAACVWLLRRMPGVALFGLGVLVLSFGSSAGAPQGMIRYVLAVPAIFLMLAWLGRRAVFDRVWVLASTLLMGMLVMLFTFGFWVS